MGDLPVMGQLQILHVCLDRDMAAGFPLHTVLTERDSTPEIINLGHQAGLCPSGPQVCLLDSSSDGDAATGIRVHCDWDDQL